MHSCKGKVTYNNLELAHTPTRPPWRPAASSITANLDLEVPSPQWTASKPSQSKSTELTIPPQYMSATDLLAAMPKRQRRPKPQTLSNVLTVEEPRVYPKTPWAPTSQHDAADFGKPSKRSSEQTPNSVLDQAASDAKLRSTTGKHGSQLASPPSPPSSANIAAQSERDFGGSRMASRQKKSQQMSPGIPPEPGSSPPRSNDRASPASPAGSARSLEHSPTISRHRNTANELPSTNPRPSRHDMRGSSRMNTTDSHHHNVPSRGTTTIGGSVRSMSACSSVMDGVPASGRCSPPTPPRPSSPTISRY